MNILVNPATAENLGLLDKIINYELIDGNEIWRFVIVLLIIIIVLAIGRIAQFILAGCSKRNEQKRGLNPVSIFLQSIAKPVSLAFFAIGLFMCKWILVFAESAAPPKTPGISASIGNYWIDISKAILAAALAYAIYRLVDIVEFYLLRLTSKTKTKLDDMLVPVIRKSLRVTIVIISVLWIADGILGAQMRTILLSAGVGGIAVALAAKDTIANFFGSITIFADKPFQIEDMIRVGDYYGPVEEVGFRSTKIRTLQGHLVTIPNSVVANSMVENISQRPFIRRTSNITITYDSGHTKAQQAVKIIKEVLELVPEVNWSDEKKPKVYFSDFNDWSLNIYMSYWVKPADYWLFYGINERVNVEIMKQFEDAKIEFAFPTQTLHINKL